MRSEFSSIPRLAARSLGRLVACQFDRSTDILEFEFTRFACFILRPQKQSSSVKLRRDCFKQHRSTNKSSDQTSASKRLSIAQRTTSTHLKQTIASNRPKLHKLPHPIQSLQHQLAVMSFFSRSSAPAVDESSQQQSARQQSQQNTNQSLDLSQSDMVREFRHQLTSMASLFDGLNNVCFAKCVTKYSGSMGDLTVGEEVCTDRCVLKYLEATSIIGATMKAQQEKSTAQQSQTFQ